MRILIAVMTCHTRIDRANSVRETWKKDIPPHVDCRFFVGRGGEVLADTIPLNVPDDYLGLIAKSQALHEWAYNQDYDFVFKADDDTAVHVGRLLGSGFEKHDYFGHIHTWPGGLQTHPHGFCGGGEGYWLSRRACSYLRIGPLPEVETYAEDRWVGDVVGRNGITMIDHPWYGTRITRHGSLARMIEERPYTADWMFEAYEELRRC